MRRLTAAVVAAGFLCAAHAAAGAPSDDAIVFAHGTSLWRVSVQPDATPVKIAALDQRAGRIDRIAATTDGAVILAVSRTDVLVAKPTPGEVASARSLACEPPAQLSAAGDAVLCRRGAAAVRVDLERPVIRVLRHVGGTPAGFLGTDSQTAVVAGDDAIGAVSFADGRRRLLAPHSPASREVYAAPSGRRAVASYRRGDDRGLFTFRLDGRGVRRALMTGASAVAWSADSDWLAVQRGRRACLVRAVGGQYQCWRRHRAVGLAPDGQRILLARGERPRALYVAPLAGARPAKPRLLVERAGTGAAAWITTP